MATLSRKTVTVLFSDVVGSTPLGEAADPETVRALMARYFDEMRVVIERHGGTVEKYIGDEIMAVFGIPRVHEDDALRAVRAACDMRTALAALNRQLPQTLRVRTALNTGEVVTGEGHTLVTGDAVNTAARLRGVAAPGEILAGAATYDLVRDAVVAEPLDPVELKGKSGAVGAWRVTAVVPDAPGRARRLDSKLVGRDTELTLLRQAHARAVGARSCHLFTVLGAAGVGKSRLVNRLFADVRPEATTLVGRCLSYGEGITYWPLRDIVHAIGDVAELVDEAEAAAICGAVGLTDTVAGRDETFRAVRRLIEALARVQPVVVGFDDLHWAEPTFLDLVDHLAETIRDAPVLLVCLARPELLEERPSWGGGKLNATTILLEPLDGEQSDELVANLGGGEIPRALRRTITEVTEGNPLFIEEMVAMALEDPNAASVPPTIHALLTARLERLPEAERTVAAAASVAGRFFSRDAVAVLVGRNPEQELAALARKELIRPQPVPFTSGDGYRFRHVLIRDAAYDALPKAERAGMHERLAAWFGTAGGEVDELVGWHLERAYTLRSELGVVDPELAERARVALTAVGRRALARGDDAAAASLIQRALSLAPEGKTERVELLIALATALGDRGELVRADETLRAAAEEAEAIGDRRLVARAQIEHAFVQLLLDPQEWVEEVPTVARRAIGELETAGDATGLARAWLLAMLFDYFQCRWRDLEAAFEPALRYAERSGDRRQISATLNASVRAVLFSPLPVEDSLAHCDAIDERAGGDTTLHAVVRGVRACLLAMALRFDEARAEYNAGHAMLEELESTRLLAVQRAYSGYVELLAGDPVAAERELAAGIAVLERIGDVSTRATHAALLAHALHAQGRAADALPFAAFSERHASRADVISQVEWRIARSRLAKDPHAAVAFADDAVAIARETDSPTLLADSLVALRDALRDARDADAAARAGSEADELYVAKGNLAGAQRAGDVANSAASSASTRRATAGGT